MESTDNRLVIIDKDSTTLFSFLGNVTYSNEKIRLYPLLLHPFRTHRNTIIYAENIYESVKDVVDLFKTVSTNCLVMTREAYFA